MRYSKLEEANKLLAIYIWNYDTEGTYVLLNVIFEGILSGPVLETCWLNFLCRLSIISQESFELLKEFFTEQEAETVTTNPPSYIQTFTNFK